MINASYLHKKFICNQNINKMNRKTNTNPSLPFKKVITSRLSYHFLAWALFWASFSVALPCPADEPATVRIKNGRIEERVKGTLRRTYGSNLVDADTDGVTVAGVTKDGKIVEYKNGTLRRTFGSNINRIRVRNGRIYAQLKNGKTAEYENGTLKRIY